MSNVVKFPTQKKARELNPFFEAACGLPHDSDPYGHKEQHARLLKELEKFKELKKLEQKLKQMNLLERIFHWPY